LYVNPNTLILRSVWESLEVCHGDSYISAWRLEYLLVPNHVEGVIKVIRDQLALLLICSSLSTISVALFTLLSLLLGFSVNDWFIVADIENQISLLRWKNRKSGKSRGVMWEIQVIICVLRA